MGAEDDAADRRDEQGVAAEEGRPGEPWPVVATFQLWLLYLQQERYAESEKLFAGVSARYPRFEQVIAIVPVTAMPYAAASELELLNESTRPTHDTSRSALISGT